MITVPVGYELEPSPGIGNRAPSAVPEPVGTWAMLAAGIVVLIVQHAEPALPSYES